MTIYHVHFHHVVSSVKSRILWSGWQRPHTELGWAQLGYILLWLSFGNLFTSSHLVFLIMSLHLVFCFFRVNLHISPLIHWVLFPCFRVQKAILFSPFPRLPFSFPLTPLNTFLIKASAPPLTCTKCPVFPTKFSKKLSMYNNFLIYHGPLLSGWNPSFRGEKGCLGAWPWTIKGGLEFRPEHCETGFSESERFPFSKGRAYTPTMEIFFYQSAEIVKK